MTVSDFIWDYLYKQGVTHVYFLPGGGSMHLVDALCRHDKLKPVAMLHEQACGIASMAHNIYENRLASVVCVTTGPGGLNALTPCGAAWVDETPMMFISGQVPTSMMATTGERQKGPQEISIAPLVDGMTCYSMVCIGAFYLDSDMEWLVRRATEYPCGPVWYDIPLDIQGAKFVSP